MQLCQPRVWVPGSPSLSSGQQYPVPLLHLGGDGLSTQPCPHGQQGAGGCGEQPSVLCWCWREPALQDWEGLCPAFRCLGHSASLCWDSITFKQLGEILGRLEKCSKSIG